LKAAGISMFKVDVKAPGLALSYDVEYPGHEATIRGLLLNHIWRIQPDFPKETITFGHIGKKSKAHAKALAVYRRREPPDLRVSARDLLALLKQK
jgi:hypothetical protein